MAINGEKYIDLGVKVALFGGGLFLIKKMMANADKGNAEDKVLSDSNAALADELFLLLHPNGGGWLSFTENVNEEKVIAWAKNPMDFNKVASYYSKLTKGQHLLDEVKKALNETEYPTFTANLRKSDTTGKSTTAQKNVTVTKKVTAKHTGGIKKVFAEVATYDTKTKRYKLGDNTEKIYYKDGITIGTLIAPVAIYFPKYGKYVNYLFVEGTGATAGKKLFVLASQTIIK
jgi:hypothetical protein